MKLFLLIRRRIFLVPFWPPLVNVMNTYMISSKLKMLRKLGTARNLRWKLLVVWMNWRGELVNCKTRPRNVLSSCRRITQLSVKSLINWKSYKCSKRKIRKNWRKGRSKTRKHYAKQGITERIGRLKFHKANGIILLKLSIPNRLFASTYLDSSCSKMFFLFSCDIRVQWLSEVYLQVVFKYASII